MSPTIDPFVHVIAGLVLLGRLGDIMSTRLVTPTLALEANPVARRLGWPFAWSTLLLCFIPYLAPWVELAPWIGVILAVTSLFVCGSNLSRAWIVRAVGEGEYLEIIKRAARRTTLGAMVGFILAGACAFAIPGLALCYFGDGPFAFFFGAGVVGYSVAIGSHGSFAARRLRHSAMASS